MKSNFDVGTDCKHLSNAERRIQYTRANQHSKPSMVEIVLVSCALFTLAFAAFTALFGWMLTNALGQ